ncbi:uncharacterized protein LOC114246730 [Bombyx mandarina]|uniref:Uncharacterized protein LOC114246730 n=1 Tax=Bombyx mandarina TaxID=7092 RepID=A0A6J2K014_BOMMA|nr:uncharacterized protein LOC114246730 [Bombyx mandarina]
MWKLCFYVTLCNAVNYFDRIEEMLRTARRTFEQPNYNESFFSSLENYEVNAKLVTEVDYPWIARVVHSTSDELPHICTAVCIEDRIFITAARCIFSLKPQYTRIIYNLHNLKPIAFVIPRNGSKQAFDDIGFITVQDYDNIIWNVIQPLQGINRTDEMFDWFVNIEQSYGPIEYRVVGYTSPKGIHTIKTVDRIYSLTELDVVSNMDLCSNIMTYFDKIKGFKVPCYHSCDLPEFIEKNKRCENYHGVEGGAVFDKKKNQLIGVATWGAYYSKYELPVGYSVANSDNFYADYMCAKRIKMDNDMLVTNGHYQHICDFF